MENPLDLPTPPVEQPEPTIPRPNDLTGRTLGDFQLTRKLGQGGMGQVYLARQISLKRQVAVKILRTDLASNITALKRFQHEAEAVARVTHANIVQVYAIGESDGLHYMALEYVEGRNLRDYINRKGPPEVAIAITIMRQVAAALHRASELGFVHRDIKPENILLTRKGEVKVADFGLSRCFTTDQPLNITQSGITMGTPLYMSPEQVQGHVVDPRSDIYSFGVTCFHMLTGEPPFRGQTPFEVALQHVQNEPPPLAEARPDLSPDLCAIVHKMMAKKPEDRYQTAREIMRDLARLRDGLPTAAAQLALGQSNPSNPTLAQGDFRSPSGSTTMPVAVHSVRWGRWALFLILLVAAGAAGAAIHWQTTPDLASRPLVPLQNTPEQPANPAESRERELQKILRDTKVKSDLEVTNAILDLAMLYVNDRQPDKALQLFEYETLRKTPALIESQKLYKLSQGQYLSIISALGKGIVRAHLDMPDESNAEFKKVMVLPILAKTRPVNQLDIFLWRYDRWKRLTADSLERNAKNLNLTKLDEPLNRYRGYSSKMP